MKSGACAMAEEQVTFSKNVLLHKNQAVDYSLFYKAVGGDEIEGELQTKQEQWMCCMCCKMIVSVRGHGEICGWNHQK